VNPDVRRLLLEELVGLRDFEVQIMFMEKYQKQLEKFVDHMSAAFSRWGELDGLVSKDEQSVIVAAYSYGALHHHLLAMKLLICGYFAASGNAQRYVLECMATCLLASSDSRLRQRILEGKYSESKSITALLRKSKMLGLDQDAVKLMEKEIRRCDRLSHPSLLALSSTSLGLCSNPKIVI
jgi:hypothetical protein